MREAAAKNTCLGKAEVVCELTDLLLIFVNEFTACLAVHADELVSNRPYSAADTLPRFDHDNPVSAPFEFSCSDETCQTRAHNHH
jgi:hypothetical protein